MGLMVKKRGGSVVDFDPVRIANAIEKAYREKSGDVDSLSMWKVTENAISAVMDVGARSTDPLEVERIQNIVETSLMSDGEYEVAKLYILYRDRRKQIREALLPADNSLIADYIHVGKYARYRRDLGRRETYEETVHRVMSMHLRKFPHLGNRIVKAFNSMYAKAVLASMRSAQFGGAAIEQCNARIFNCAFSLLDRPRVFAEAFYLLLAGCGTGFSVQRQHVAKLPQIKPYNYKDVRHFTVPDTIQGWAEALDALMNSLFGGYYVEFDYSQIRPEGTELKTSGGRAPGHLPLKTMLEKVREFLKVAQGRHMRPIEAHDVMCWVAEAVLSGGIRRSSLISLFSLDDEEMMTCKTPGVFRYPYGSDPGLNAQRAMANNSAVCLRSTVTHDEFSRIFQYAKEYGEPGFFFTDNLNYGCNPCAEAIFDPIDEQTGETGWSFCNLNEINAAKCETPDDFLSAARDAAIIGTLQAAYTDIPYLGPVTKRILERDALLGVGITGMQDNPRVALNPELQRQASLVVVDTNREFAAKIGINPAARCTVVKPSGTASLILNAIGSGIHYHHARRYFRRVTANPNERPAQHFRSVNPHMVEVKPNGDWCITFPVEAPEGAKTVKSADTMQFLDEVFSTYDNWIVPGTTRGDLTHNVSCTVTVRDGEWDAVRDKVWDNRHRVGGMSFLPMMSDKGIPFMPREEVTTEGDVVKWNALIHDMKLVDYRELREDDDVTDLKGEVACAGGACDVR